MGATDDIIEDDKQHQILLVGIQSDGTPTKVLCDATGKLQITGSGDITSVVAGTGLTGGATSGAATVNVIGGTGITANADDISITAGGVGTTQLANDAVTADKLAANAVVNASVAAGAAIDATKIADGSVTSAEFQYINTLSSNAQTQLATKEQIGKKTMWIPSAAMSPTVSNGCSALTTVETTAARPDMVVLDFDKDSDEFAQFSVAFPKSWNLGTVTFQVFWSGIAATTDCDWQLQGVAMNDNETIDVAYGTAVVVTDNAQGAVEELLVSAESGAVTIAGTPADNALCYFRVGRDVSGDDMAGDARLHGIKLFYTTDAVNDA